MVGGTVYEIHPSLGWGRASTTRVRRVPNVPEALTLEAGEVGGQVGSRDLLLQNVCFVEEEDDRRALEPGQLQDGAKEG